MELGMGRGKLAFPCANPVGVINLRSNRRTGSGSFATKVVYSSS
ncbi:hypothetical protein [Mastigocoleus testarum]|nr:hypothetical protein [Mastigocoleus testarum]